MNKIISKGCENELSWFSREFPGSRIFIGPCPAACGKKGNDVRKQRGRSVCPIRKWSACSANDPTMGVRGRSSPLLVPYMMLLLQSYVGISDQALNGNSKISLLLYFTTNTHTFKVVHCFHRKCNLIHCRLIHPPSAIYFIHLIFM